MEQRLVLMSKFLSYTLRHQPEAEGLVMDERGWVSVKDLLSAKGAKKRGLTQEILELVVIENDKQRFEFNCTGEKIRARQGHSRGIEFDWEPVGPPKYLYHGTSSHAVASIRSLGLQKRCRHHVHLSADPATAKVVGARHGLPVVLTIRALEMFLAGHNFYFSTNGVWLVDAVPSEFIEFHDADPLAASMSDGFKE